MLVMFPLHTLMCTLYCLQGHCHVLGCDGVLDSTAKEDSCGVCGGNNSNCHNVTNTFHRKLHRCELFKKLLFRKLIFVPCKTLNKSIWARRNGEN
jgi:hypothetical protein